MTPYMMPMWLRLVDDGDRSVVIDYPNYAEDTEKVVQFITQVMQTQRLTQRQRQIQTQIQAQ